MAVVLSFHLREHALTGPPEGRATGRRVPYHGHRLARRRYRPESPTTAIGWLDGNFADRVSIANREVGYRLHGTVLERIISGEIKSPGVIKMVLESLLPELYGKDADPKDNEGKNAMTLLREMHKEWLDNKARDEGILFDTQRAQELSGAPVTLTLPDRVQRDSNGIAGSD